VYSRAVAIKVLPGDVNARPEAIARFEREVRAVASEAYFDARGAMNNHRAGTHTLLDYYTAFNSFDVRP